MEMNTAIIELYKMYVQEPKGTKIVLKNIMLHDLHALLTMSIDAGEKIKDYNEIKFVREDLDELPCALDDTIITLSYFMTIKVVEDLSGETLMVDFINLQKEAFNVREKFDQAIEADDQLGRGKHSDKAKLDEGKKAAQEALAALKDSIDELGLKVCKQTLEVGQN